MKKINALMILTKILILLMLFWTYTENILLVYVGILFVLSFTLFLEYFSIFNKDSGIFIAIFVSFALSAAVNLSGIDESYLKIVMNGMIWLFLIYYGFTLGKLIKSMPEQINKIVNFVSVIFLINAIVNIFVWFTTTGGIIARYNFVSPLTMSTSAGINLSSLGFFLSLEKFKLKKCYTWFPPIVFFMNIVIIVTRKEQLLFCIYLAYYIFIKIKNNKNAFKKLFLFFNTGLAIFVIIFFFQDYFLSTYSKYYVNLFSASGQDMIVRDYARQAALNMFYENPLLGKGYGTFSMQSSSLTVLASAHNGVFSILAETGILGIIVNIFLAVPILYSAYTLIKGNNGNIRYHIVFAVFLVSAVLTAFISNYALLPPPSERVYYLYGFVLWIIYGITKENINIKTKKHLVKFNLK